MLNTSITSIESCTGCCGCYNVCPRNAISMEENVEGFVYPNIDLSKCTECGLCKKKCQKLNGSDFDNNMSVVQKAFYGWHNNETVRFKSSSGGIFSALAERCLEKNGIVFGAAYDCVQKKVIHKCTKDIDLKTLRKSKYVQSYIGNSFSRVKKMLNNNKDILFVGTPCQIAGLNKFLGNSVDNLITCDFICHGVPSMKLLNDHCMLLEKKIKTNIIDIDFRPKTKGWSSHAMKFFFHNETTHEIPANKDAYLTFFYKNLSLRKSCYGCSYCDKQHNSDLTIADYWGYRRLNPNIGDERGISLLIANTKKGEAVINTLTNVSIKEIEWKYAEYVFTSRDQNSYNDIARNNFFRYYVEYGWEKTIKKFHFTENCMSSLKQYIKKCISYFFSQS